MIKPSKNSLTILAAGTALWFVAIGVAIIHNADPDDLDQQIAQTSEALRKLQNATEARAKQATASVELVKASLWTPASIDAWKAKLPQEWITEPFGPAERRSVSLQTYTLELDQAPYDTGWPLIIQTIRALSQQRNVTLRTVTIQGAPAPAQLFQRVFISASFAANLP
jgi:hypothetical protein